MSYGIIKTDKQVSGTTESFNEVIKRFYKCSFNYEEFIWLKSMIQVIPISSP